ncbi:MAG: DUF664 domain-containing protein [Actinobacteria bacterium]|nr:DUF664 domain-containing protein [Actinomycetota bacterium]
MSLTYDAVVVGARCAGSVLAIRLARAGWDVLLVDQARFPSDTVSTHFMFPNTLARLERLGVMKRLRAAHDIPQLLFSWGVLGQTVAGSFTPVDGYERMSCVGRVVLDHALVETAVEAGASTRFGVGVTGLVTESDGSVAGVVLQGGEQVRARWVFGADGRNSTVARSLGLKRLNPLRGDMSLLFAYWTGLPETEWFRLEIWEDRAITWSPCEDGSHILVVAGGPDLARGNRRARQARYLEWVRRFPSVIDSRALDRGRQTSDLVVAPEAMMRGFFRRAKGNGWALIGDAGHYKHPSIAQGISDAVEQADYVADALLGEDPDLGRYEKWRDARSQEQYLWSFRAATWPVPERHIPIYAGFAADENAGQQWRDMFNRLHQPSEVYTAERIGRWTGARPATSQPATPEARRSASNDLGLAYAEARIALGTLLRGLDGALMERRVPACPAWTLEDLVAHLAGEAADFVEGAYFLGVSDAWRDPDVAATRDAWTAGQVASREQESLDAVLAEWDKRSPRLEDMLSGRTAAPDRYPPWLPPAVVADLAVHLHDAYGALGKSGDRSIAASQVGLRVYVRWLEIRLAACGRPALLIRAPGAREWLLGAGNAAATLTTDSFDLFRALSGRRSRDQLQSLAWQGDPEPFLDLLSPYELPRSSLIE